MCEQNQEEGSHTMYTSAKLGEKCRI